MTKKLIIFDCDGVLVDSEFIACKVFSEALSKYGYTISPEESERRFTGVNEHDCRRMIMEESGIDIPENYWDLQRPALEKAYETELVPLLKPVLKMLERLGIPRCVASNSSRKYIFRCLELTDQLGYFVDRSIFSFEQVARPKPAPDLFLFAAETMGVKQEECLVIEDSGAGAEAAAAAGMQAVLFLGGRHARSEEYRKQIAPYRCPMLFDPEEVAAAIRQALKTGDR